MNFTGRFSTFLRFLIFVIVWIIFYYGQPNTIMVYDEGSILTGAFRVLSGEIPSANFYTNYGPAQFFLVAAAMELFGRSADSGRLLHSLILALSLFVSYKLMLSLGIRKNALYPLSLIFALLLYHGTAFPLYPAITCIPLMLFGCILIIRLFDFQVRFQSFIPIALLISIVSLFRYDLGLMAMLAFAIPLLLVDPFVGGGDRLKCRTNYFRLMQYGVVVSVVLFFVLGGLFAAGILEPALRDILTYNGKNYIEMRSLPIPSLRYLFRFPIDIFPIYLPMLSITMGIIVCASYYIPNRSAQDRSYLSIVVVTAVTLGLFFKGLVRTSPIHMLMADVPAVILFVLCFRYPFKKFEFWTSSFNKNRSFVVSAIFFLIVVFAALQHRMKSNSVLYMSPGSSVLRSNIPTLGSLSIDPSTAEAIEYLVESTEPYDRILVATGRHDKVFAINLSIYYLAQRLPGTRWHHYDPGVQTTKKIQLEMIRDLKHFEVDWVVVDSEWDKVNEPNKSAESSGVFLLDKYISENYTVAKRFGTIEIRRR